MKRWSLILLVFLTLFMQKKGFGNYCIDYQALSSHSICYFQIFGERCSGTNYLQSLLEKNFPDCKISWKYGWKHFPCWYDTPWVRAFHFENDPIYSELSENKEFLFIIIFRHPYDWLRSFYLQPHHVAEEHNHASFSTFIRDRWRLNRHCYKYDLDPINLCELENVMRLRTAKIRNMLKIKEKVLNVYYVNYEILRDKPHKVIAEISRLFSLKKQKKFRKQKNYKGNKGKRYNPIKYAAISMEDIYYINIHLDRELEAYLGYQLKKFSSY